MMNKILLHLRAPVRSASGYGVHARQIIDYLLTDDRFLVCLEDIPWGSTPSIHEQDLESPQVLKSYYEAMLAYETASKEKRQFHLSVQVTIPNEFSKRAQVNIGVTAGIEVDRANIEWIRKCNEMDIIVVPSKFSADILGNTAYQITEAGQSRVEKIEKQIFVIPEWFNKPAKIDELNIKFSTDKNLLFVGLWGNKGGFGEDRKNVSDLIRLFLTECRDRADVGLVLKTSIITNSPEDLFHTKEKIKQIRSSFPDAKCKIHLVHDHLTDSEMWSLYHHKQIQGFISLTHGEGWGLPLLEAAASGLPVIATDWSGHKDFLRQNFGFLPLNYELKDIPDCQHWQGVMERGSRWACVDDSEVKRRLKKFFESSAVPRKQAQENIPWLESNFSKTKVCSIWREFFDGILGNATASTDDVLEESVDPKVMAVRHHRDQLLNVVKQIKAKHKIEAGMKKSAVFLMPRSFGDCVISTSIIRSLIVNRHSEDQFYIVTTPQYEEIFSAIVEEFDARILFWEDIFMNDEVCRNIWDYVYNPTVNVQYTFSNWNLGNGEFGVRLLEEFAKNCNLNPSELVDYCLKPKVCGLPKKNYVSITPVSMKQSKDYKYWSEVVFNLRKMGDFEIIQLGDSSEKLLDGVLDYRGKSFNETIYVVSRSILHISPDTGTAHVAGALGVPHIVLFGSTSYNQCAPVLFKRDASQVVIDSSTSCELKCYKDVCWKMEGGKNCLSSISPKTISDQAFELISGINTGKTRLPVLRLDSKKMQIGVSEWISDTNHDKDIHESLGLTKEQYEKYIENKFEEL
jgi:ADP-heptose:LPS heptosyltransferase/glycosyltransferase involved in cell wall biosynthesis